MDYHIQLILIEIDQTFANVRYAQTERFLQTFGADPQLHTLLVYRETDGTETMVLAPKGVIEHMGETPVLAFAKRSWPWFSLKFEIGQQVNL